MKGLMIGAGLALVLGGAAMAQTHEVQGYYRSNGTYVAPHVSANPGASATTATPYGGLQPDHQVSGYTTQTGTYVQPYHATNPNATRMDNYGTRGNVNPYTGQPGTQSPY